MSPASTAAVAAGSSPRSTSKAHGHDDRADGGRPSRRDRRPRRGPPGRGSDRHSHRAARVGIPRGRCRGARRRVGPRRNSVFPAPARAVLGATTYPEACARSRQASGKAISKQLFNILGKIAEVDALVTPALQERFVEMFPEWSLAVLAGAPMAQPKTTAAGRAERAAALGVVFGDASLGAPAAPSPGGPSRRRTRCLRRGLDGPTPGARVRRAGRRRPGRPGPAYGDGGVIGAQVGRAVLVFPVARGNDRKVVVPWTAARGTASLLTRKAS